METLLRERRKGTGGAALSQVREWRLVGVERMLRVYFCSSGSNLSDPAVEDALYDSEVMR